ncbi:MAG: hypothetical protein KTR16_15295 [Acidiferrobacterales bacterium]|nr:hypothetical protein [Acidiferrobacterales bacterium]
MRNFFSKSALNKLRVILVPLLLVSISACQTGGSPAGVPGGSPLPSLPGGGGSAGTPSSDPSSPMPSSSSQGSAESGESDDAPPEGDPSAEGESTADTAPDWEEEIESEGEAAQDSEVTFEESDPNSDVTFEEPAFEDGGLTEQELEELEKELNESLGDFDEDIQREKTFAEERANENVDDGPLGGVGVFESYEEDQAGSSNSSTAASGSAQGNSSAEGVSSSDSSESANAGSVSGDQESQSEGIGDENEEEVTLVDIPEEIVDDDIVARQIREAAENETDPELKEALWAEYRKYKNQQ